MTPARMILIDTTHPLYPAELDLRYRGLRRPLGFAPEDTATPFEKVSVHLIALLGEEVVGCVLFRPLEKGRGRLFQMVVDPRVQRSGIGKQLVANLEMELCHRGIDEVVLHARQEAIPFYERAGYEPEGEPFTEVGIPHRRMRKRLVP